MPWRAKPHFSPWFENLDPVYGVTPPLKALHTFSLSRFLSCAADVFLQVLTRLRHYLCDKIRADRHLDYLRSRRILTRDDAEEISCRTTQTKRTATLLDILAENPRGLDALVDSIRELRSQTFIITKITDEVQKAKNEKLESLRGRSSGSWSVCVVYIDAL